VRFAPSATHSSAASPSRRRLSRRADEAVARLHRGGAPAVGIVFDGDGDPQSPPLMNRAAYCSTQLLQMPLLIDHLARARGCRGW